MREERKRAGWGAPTNPVNPTNDVSPRNDAGAQRVGRPPQNPASMAVAPKRPNAGPRGNAGGGGGPRNPSPGARAYRETPEHKQAKMDDLRMTLNSGQGQAVVDQNLLTFHEKVDNIMEE